MPDLSILVELADFYEVDIRDIIDGERKSETMNSETTNTLKKVAEYTAEETKKLKNKMADFTSAIFYINGANEHYGTYQTTPYVVGSPFVCAKQKDRANKDADTSSVSLRLPPSPTGEGS